MRRTWLTGLACLCLIFVGCGGDSDTTNVDSDNQMGEGGAAGSGTDDNGGNGTDGSGTGGNGGNGTDGSGGDGAGGDLADAGSEPEVEPIGAPNADAITLTHEMVVDGLRGNITQHMDEIDSSLSMFEESGMIDTIIGL